MPILEKIDFDPAKRNNSPDYQFWCPGCKCFHAVWTTRDGGYSGSIWSFNGNVDCPTLNPSLLITFPDPDNVGKNIKVCHSFVHEGKMQYLADSTHSLARQTVQLKPYQHEE